MNDLLILIKQLITNAVDASIFASDSIRYGFNPNFGNNFITYTVMTQRKMGVRGQYAYNNTNETATSTQTIENHVQIDCFSDNTINSYQNAYDGANSINNYLTNFAQSYINTNNLQFGIGEVSEVMNLTQLGDKGKYLFRFSLRCTIFSNQVFTQSQQFVDSIIINTQEIV